MTIPYPAAPTAVTNVQLIDLDIETASAPMKVTWDASTHAGVEEYRVYVAQSIWMVRPLPLNCPVRRITLSEALLPTGFDLSSSTTELELTHTVRIQMLQEAPVQRRYKMGNNTGLL